MTDTKPSFKVVDILPFKDQEVQDFQLLSKKEPTTQKTFAPTNRYAKYLEDDYSESEEDDFKKPGHYKKMKKSKIFKLKKEFKPEPSFDESFNSSVMAYEGGGRGGKSEKSGTSDKKITDTKYNKNDPKFTKSTIAAGDKVKNLFNNENVLGHTHLQKVGDEMQKHGSKEKTGFMEKEADFVKELK
jgi:hypothetical protein